MIPTSSSFTAGGIVPASIRPTGPSGSTTPNSGGAHVSPPPQSSQGAADRPITIADLDVLGTPRSAMYTSAPAGTDPDLWRALSPDERAFFARTPRSDAPVYNGLSAIRGASAPMRRGLHLDLKG